MSFQHFQGEIENQGTFVDMQNSGLNFAKLLATEENEKEADDSTSEMSPRMGTKSGINMVSCNKRINVCHQASPVLYKLTCSIRHLQFGTN